MGAAASAVPLDFSDISAFEGASIFIAKKMEEKGSISPEEALKTILHYNAISETAKKFFPKAEDGKIILKKVKNVLKRLDIDATNTLYAQSICPDEINHEQGDITELFRDHIGEVFHLGGLAGIPFTGKTGFAAFSHHVPDGGNLFVLMAPHIGISDDCQLGQYSRDGQAHNGAACGAACGAYKLCCSKTADEIPNLHVPANFNDYQMNFIIDEISKRVDIIKAKGGENEQQAELAQQCYDISKNFLDQILSTDFGHGKGRLLVLSGIQINMPRPMNDYFQPRCFYLLQQGQEPLDLFQEAFN